MKNNNKIVENIPFIIFILLPSIMIIFRRNGITLMNNTYGNLYVIIYAAISIKFIFGTNKNSKLLGLFVLTYVLFEFCAYTGSYESYKSPNNKNTVIVEYMDVFPNDVKLKVSKRTCIIFKKELVETPTANSGHYKVLWKGDNSVIVTGTPIASFRNSYENGSLDNHYKNMIKKGKFELFSSEGMIIKIE
ncbi:hypothetical protein J2Z44_002631 [Clostridium punense]|uniref:Uncharacterized protein n=1 Tax=Clostridium punense TaxID=1054297 RepID=A0ABS4K6D1_9CLOT|nr:MULTISPECIES: hypothetical protein [Clostridium]EQB86106.1 hypothetical protein M918_16005 [Clostridium sp. BL8]MBP2022806.1 hypothetical protein [Clostridium punense]